MSNNNIVFEQCLRQLVKQGKKYGGYVTYQIITNTLSAQRDISMDAIDLIYEYLASEGIDIVDQLPVSSIVTDDFNLKDTGESIQQYQYRIKKSRRERKYDYAFIDETDENEYSLCPEEAIDKLIYHWERKGSLSKRYFLSIISKCKLTIVEIKELMDYLRSKGIDVPDISFDNTFYDIKDGKAYNEEENDFLIDPYIQNILMLLSKEEQIES